MNRLGLTGHVVPSGAESAAGARRVACEAARSFAGRDTWVAMTDADSVVPPSWVSTQLALAECGADAVVGEITLGHDSDVSQSLRQWYADLIASRRGPGGHLGAYGANIGLAWDSLMDVGGIPDVACGEDRELVRRLRESGLCVATPTHPVVTTSARLSGRAPGGLADLLRLNSQMAGVERPA